MEFLIEFAVAPHKRAYLRRNWFSALSLLFPAFRAFHAVRALHALRFARVIHPGAMARLVTGLNWGFRSVRTTLGRRGIGHAAGLTVLVLFTAAAAILALERPTALRAAGIHGVQPTSGITSYADAVWWSAMMLTTFGSDYSPQTAGGRTVAWILSVFALVVFGYITANITTAFLERETRDIEAELEGEAGFSAEENTALRALAAEVAALREEVARARQPFAPTVVSEGTTPSFRASLFIAAMLTAAAT